MGLLFARSFEDMWRKREATLPEALAYMQKVKDEFKDDEDKYNVFLEALEDFKEQRIDTAEVVTRLDEVFRGHEELFQGFNAFVPMGYEIRIPITEGTEAGSKFLNDVCRRFGSEGHVYRAFLEIQNMNREGKKTFEEVYDEIAFLFSQHADLMDEFGNLLPRFLIPRTKK